MSFNFKDIEKKLGYKFKNKQLLLTAFTHSSYANFKNEKSNERLEFLGDTVLNASTTFFLFEKFKEPEGELSKVRAYLVSSQNISKCIDRLDLISYLRSYNFNPNNSEGVKCDLFEAILGAMYLDSNFDVCYKFVLKNLKYSVGLIQKLMKEGHDFKTKLQEFVQKTSNEHMEYKLLSKTGPSHMPVFKVAVVVNGKELSFAEASNKKQAENLAAEKAYRILNEKNGK